MKYTSKRAIVVVFATALCFIALGVLIGGASPGFHWKKSSAEFSLTSQEKKGMELLNKRFSVVRISSVVDGKLIGLASPNRLMADVLTEESMATDVKSEILLQTKSGEVMLLQSAQADAENAMINAYADLWHVEAAEKNQVGELFSGSGGAPSIVLELDDSPKAARSPVRQLRVAVIDSGIDDKHPALADGVWNNLQEANGTDGVDDDNNGRIDDIEGWDFVNDSADVSDSVGHGTHVTGVISAKPTYLSDMSGVNPQGAEVMILKVADDKHGLRLANVIAALHYAKNNGADVINMSFGFSEDSRIFRNAIRDIKENGTYLVAAAGNNADSSKQYPAAYDEVLSVGSANIDGGRWRTSNFGEWVDINVPGKLLSTLPGSRYGTKSGTSQAAALITGLYSYLKYTDPDLDDETIISIITEFAHSFETDAFTSELTAMHAAADWTNIVAAILREGRFPDLAEAERYDLQKVITRREAYTFLLHYFGMQLEVVDAIRSTSTNTVALTASPNQLLERYLQPETQGSKSSTKEYLSEQDATELLLLIEQNIYTEIRKDSPLLLYLSGNSPYISRETFIDFVFQAFSQQ